MQEPVAVEVLVSDEVALLLREGEIDPLPLRDAVTEPVPVSLEELDEEIEALPLTL